MVQVMETWFMADGNLLHDYFGPDLREAHLPKWPVLEDVTKTAVLKALDQSTAGCTKCYSKGRVWYQLLEKLTPSTVEAACPHEKALVDRLRLF